MNSGSLKTEAAGYFKTFSICLTEYTVTFTKIVILIQLESLLWVLHTLFQLQRLTV
jgi:hypothetical protein